MLGHSKTILVLLGGWAFLGDPVSAKQLSGMALAVLGMVLYGIASSQCVPSPKPRAGCVAVLIDTSPLLYKLLALAAA